MRAIEDIALKELIPQRPPFVMIDRLVSSDKVYSVTELEVRPDNLFVDNGRMSAAGLVENIAQTCAARIGYINLNIVRTPTVGEHLVTTIQLLEEVFQVTLVEAIVRSGEEELARCNMKIALTDIDSKD